MHLKSFDIGTVVKVSQELVSEYCSLHKMKKKSIYTNMRAPTKILAILK